MSITVHRCVVRIVRRGGWSWGPDPRGLVQRALEALPDLLAGHFEEHLTGDGPDMEITEPVRLTVRLSALPSGGAGSVLTAGAGFAIEPGPASAVEQGFASFDRDSGPVPRPLSGTTPETGPPGAPSEPDHAPVVAEEVEATPADLFGELAERGELAAVLALLPEETLRTYLRVLRTAAASSAAHSRAEEPIGALAAELARRPSVTHDDDTAPEATSPLPRTTFDPPSPGVGAWRTAETTVCSALPFLLAGPLSRTGYLDAIGPALAGVELLEEAPLFAAALAYKVLDAPERGWRRTGEAQVAAAAFAGLASAPDLTGFARRVSPALPLLNGVLALSLCRGHDPADPLVVTGVDDGLLLVDGQGTFPIAWAAEAAGLIPHWQACGRPPVLVRDSPLPPACLRELAAAGVRFVTDVRPVRADPLTRLPWRTPLWTTGGVGPRLAAEFPVLAGRTAELARALFEARRAAPLAPERALDRSVGLAASLALGMLAWMLWRERETPDPVLALTRFADLSATVRYSRDTVSVKLPLGRRHADLWRGGALTDVPGVVWLGGRTLTFSGG
ncbi:hypothetical protein [Spongiactinospora rosea]|uniref:hypothetical protein n=1 Tax=Spongiactinospora rosea TaxID=2248750 RepID=UPI0018F4CFF3|nr:hypothetical protein [Spongiactinospora rosea]